MTLDDSIVRSRKSLLHAFISAADQGGLDDKQAAAAAGMDPSTWSQFKAGDRGIKPLVLNSYMDQCANELPLAYWAFSRGYELKPLETELERRLRIKDEQLVEERKKTALLLEALKR
jgi:hypothetical protein